MKSKQNTSNPLLIAIMMFAVTLPVVYIAGKNSSGSAGDLSNTKVATIDHSMMSMDTYEVPEGIDIPAIIDLQVTKDNKSGWNVSFETENFTFTPEKASSEHVENQGHAHLHIDGVKVSRLYSKNYYVADLEPGAHIFSVYLNTNDHKEYVVNGSGTGAEVVVTQEHN